MPAFLRHAAEHPFDASAHMLTPPNGTDSVAGLSWCDATNAPTFDDFKVLALVPSRRGQLFFTVSFTGASVKLFSNRAN